MENSKDYMNNYNILFEEAPNRVSLDSKTERKEF
jgi:hypothetical protein